jgi:hypothetical protein
MNLNENKNQPKIPEEKLKELGILKVLNVVIGEDEETKYNCVMEDGTIKTIPASSLIEE